MCGKNKSIINSFFCSFVKCEKIRRIPLLQKIVQSRMKIILANYNDFFQGEKNEKHQFWVQ